MRLFIALNLNDEIKTTLTEIQASMRRQGVRGNFTKAENLHLTLTFIGDYPAPEFVIDSLHAVPPPSFSISLEGFGSFGNLYWVGIQKCEVLSAYVKRLRKTLSDNNIPFDRKKFSPHITLIRQASMKNGLPHILVPAARLEVRHIALMRSDRTKSGMVYTELDRVTSL